MPIPLDPPKAGLDVQERTGHPPLLLPAIDPTIYLIGPLADLGHDRLQAVGGLETCSEGSYQPQAVQNIQWGLTPLICSWFTGS